MSSNHPRSEEISACLSRGDGKQARSLVYQWLTAWAASLPPQPSRRDLRNPALWNSLADVVNQTNDHYLLELLWQILEQFPPPASSALDPLPLLGIPILNRPDLLAKLLDSLDYPVGILAIVDNSILPQSPGKQGNTDVSKYLDALCQLGHPMVQQIHVARPFRNLGVAASWNLILTSFPEAPLALIANNDIQFAPGVLQAAMQRIDSTKPQFLSLLPDAAAFSVFMLTSLCWDKLGLFDPGFHPAYCEDLDYRDRIRANPEILQLDGSFAHASMAQLNQIHSSTISTDPQLDRYNQTSYALNKLWYLSHRRIRGDHRGAWRRLWLAQWADDQTG